MYDDAVTASKDDNLLDLDADEPVSVVSPGQMPSGSQGKPVQSSIDDLLGILGGPEPSSNAGGGTRTSGAAMGSGDFGGINDLAGLGSNASAKVILLEAGSSALLRVAYMCSFPSPSSYTSSDTANGKGLEISGCLRRSPLAFEMTFSNKGSVPLSEFAIQFNKNRCDQLPGLLRFPYLTCFAYETVTVWRPQHPCR